MDVKLMIQSTPNPNALKFVLNVPVKTEGNFTYKSADECAHNPLARDIFGADPSVKEVYFFDNYITVTQKGSGDWDLLEESIKKIILEKIKNHDPNFKTEKPASDMTPKAVNRTPEMDQIDAILDQTVRPALQMDGGDIQIIGYEANKVKVFYQGACGSCPSAAMGTLQAIENILKNEFNPEISVELAEA
jgi:Fe-S cluster biogenesis protein NfuA